MSDPLDELNVQLPGRLHTVEVLLTLMLRGRSDAGTIVAEARKVIALYEETARGEKLGVANDYARNIFKVANMSLDSIAMNAIPAARKK